MMMTRTVRIYQCYSPQINLRPIEALLIYVQPWVAVSLRQLRIDRVKTGSSPLGREFEVLNMGYLLLESREQLPLRMIFVAPVDGDFGNGLGFPILFLLPYVTNVDPVASVGVRRLYSSNIGF